MSALTSTLHASIGGMQCATCAGAVEMRLRAVPHVESVRVDYPSGRAVIAHTEPLDVAALHAALAPDGYMLVVHEDRPTPALRSTTKDYAAIGAAIVALGALVLALQNLHLLPRGLGVSDEMSYGLVFVIGLVASVSSCLAVTGGLLVAFAAKYNDANPYSSDRERLVPHVAFNVGRIVSYTLLGGTIGALGAALTLTPAVGGALTLLASAIMILLGLNMLGLLPGIGQYLPRPPRALSDRLHQAASRETTGAAFLLGGATFFLPCGFTQALQLYVLSKASFVTGALTMLAFALGTLPALLSLSAISSLAKGVFRRHFVRVAGAAVILLGFMNVQYGLVLTGSDMNPVAGAPVAVKSAPGTGVGEPQRIAMRVVGLDY